MGDSLWVPAFGGLMDTAKQFYDKAVKIYVAFAVHEAKERHGDSHGTGFQERKLSPEQEAAVRAKAEADAKTAFADVLDLFQAFAECPDPARFADAEESLGRAQAALAYQAVSADPLTGGVIKAVDKFSHITTTGGFVGRWSGDAARQFKANYLDMLPAQIGTQYQVAMALRGAVQAERAIWHNARKDICMVAAKGLAALDDIGECSQADWTLYFTVVASAAAVAGAIIAAPETGGASLAIGIAVVGSAAQVTGAVPIEGSSREAEYHGDTPQAVVAAVRQGIRDLVQRIREQEDGIARAIANNVTLVDQHWRELRPDPPDLGCATETNVTSDRYFGSAI